MKKFKDYNSLNESYGKEYGIKSTKMIECENDEETYFRMKVELSNGNFVYSSKFTWWNPEDEKYD